ncbi:hypothetical protein [Streptococcus parauberis]|uniref:hypothetical protein n=1 Tax=Streptococcus parauberis TaxID=1348 RepID=UPI000E3035F0|nr:hypothetical protein [Streptococcus parauberis]RFE00907.1 hypothetical protein ADO06_01780 [Streptococcus parauberis]
MSYSLEERETVITYDELSNSWQFESSVRRHITKILKTEEAFDSLDQEFENNNCVYVRARLTDLENFSVNPFVKTKRKMTEKQKQELAERLKRNLSKN